jgi:hypothetical protein
MTGRPPSNTRLRDLALPPLSDDSEAALRRARVFLYGIARPARQAQAILAGYTPDIHRDGVFKLSLLSGERSFGEWRDWRALRPPRDPDLPREIAVLAAFAEDWLARALAATSAIADEGDREEVCSMLKMDIDRSCATAKAATIVGRLRPLPNAVWEPYGVVGRALEDAGFTAALADFDRHLRTVQDAIRQAPLDKAEIADIHASRESAARHVREWLDARRTQLASFHPDELAILGLGETVPPPGFEPPIQELAAFVAPAQA